MSQYWTWQASVPNLVLFGAMVWVIWTKLHRLRMTIRDEIEKIREVVPPYTVGQQFVEQNFEEIRQSMRELKARLEHVEALLDRRNT